MPPSNRDQLNICDMYKDNNINNKSRNKNKNKNKTEGKGTIAPAFTKTL